jgi:hypothetical protein
MRESRRSDGAAKEPGGESLDGPHQVRRPKGAVTASCAPHEWLDSRLHGNGSPVASDLVHAWGHARRKCGCWSGRVLE